MTEGRPQRPHKRSNRKNPGKHKAGRGTKTLSLSKKDRMMRVEYESVDLAGKKRKVLWKATTKQVITVGLMGLSALMMLAYKMNDKELTRKVEGIKRYLEGPTFKRHLEAAKLIRG